jgi:hypothetical protein
MGVVHLAQAPDGRRIALKVLRPHVVGDEEARRRLSREVNSLGRVRSPHVAEILDADPWGPVPFVATRYVPGPALQEYVGQEGPLAGPDLHRFARGLAEALEAVHRVGVVHRDIKPSNVVMEGRAPILIDFGLARLAEDDRVTRTGWLLGTPGYLAPELLEGAEPTAAADVHAWAATVAFAGTGRPPYGRGPDLAVTDRVRRGDHDVTGLDLTLCGLVEACLDPEPARRPTLAAVLHELRTGEVARTPQPPADREPTRVLPPPAREPYQEPPPAEWTPPRRISLGEHARRWVLGLALLAVLATAAVAAPYLMLAGLAVAVLLLRWASLVGAGRSLRREARGPRWYDVPLAAVLSPLTLLGSLPGSVLLLLFTGAIVGSAGLLCAAAGVDTLPALAGLGLLAGLLVWLGPGGSRVVGPVHRVGVPLARRLVPWLAVLAVFAGLAAGLLWSGWSGGTAWRPANEAPWGPGSWLDDRF